LNPPTVIETMHDSRFFARSRRSGKRTLGPEPPSLRRRPDDGSTISVCVVTPFARYIARTGRDCEAWLGPHGLSVAMLAERDRRLPHSQFRAMLREAIAMSGEPAIGLCAAHCEQPGDFDVLEHAATMCASFGEALQLAARFIALMNDGIAMELDVAPPLAALRSPANPDHPPACDCG